MASDHDKRYKRLFSHPEIVKELLLHFINEDFIHDLDFSTLEKMDKTFITDQFKEKESDIIYKIGFKGKEIYLFLLIEFQSTVDKFMALRINRYISEFYEYLTQTSNINLLPAVFPVLLYNGEAKWTASVNLQDLIVPSIPKQYIPHISYYKIIENEIPRDLLLQIHNVVSAVFFVENSDPGELKEEFHNILILLEKEQPQIILLFKRWLNNLFETAKKEWDIVPWNEQIDDLLEVKVMFETALKERDQKMKIEGKIEGRKEGKKEGKKEIAIKMLARKLDIELIAECTGLPVREIEDLQKKLY